MTAGFQACQHGSSVVPLAAVGVGLLWWPSPRKLKAYMSVESALAAPSVAFFFLVLYQNLSPAHGFSIRELTIPLTVLLFVTAVPLFLFAAWRTLRLANRPPPPTSGAQTEVE